MIKTLYYKVYENAEEGQPIREYDRDIIALSDLIDRLKSEEVIQWEGGVWTVELTPESIEKRIMRNYFNPYMGENLWAELGGADFLVDELAGELQTYLTALADHPTNHLIVLYRTRVTEGSEDRVDSELDSIGYKRFEPDLSYRERLRKEGKSAEDFLDGNLSYYWLKRLLAPQKAD